MAVSFFKDIADDNSHRDHEEARDETRCIHADQLSFRRGGWISRRYHPVHAFSYLNFLPFVGDLVQISLTFPVVFAVCTVNTHHVTPCHGPPSDTGDRSCGGFPRAREFPRGLIAVLRRNPFHPSETSPIPGARPFSPFSPFPVHAPSVDSRVRFVLDSAVGDFMNPGNLNPLR